MIIIRHTSEPLDDFAKLRDVYVEWRDAHPDQNWRIYNSITGDQGVVVVERLFPDNDPAAVAFHLFDPKHGDWWRAQPGFQAWYDKCKAQGVALGRWATRELWRLVE